MQSSNYLPLIKLPALVSFLFGGVWVLCLFFVFVVVVFSLSWVLFCSYQCYLVIANEEVGQSWDILNVIL